MQTETTDYNAGVVFTTQYILPNDEHFQGYIDYINRSEAQRNDAYELYSSYVDNYMDNPLKQRLGEQPERTSALFTESRDRLTVSEKNKLKNQFEQAQKNQSILWQPLFSFRKEFLTEFGILDEKTGFFDEARIRDVTRVAMKELLKDEGMEDSAIWSAAIHYNTKHIHVHIAVVEPNPTREVIDRKDGHVERKGKFKKDTLFKTKSKFVNTLIDRSASHQKINSIIRDNLVAGQREKLLYKKQDFKNDFLTLYYQLPDDRRLWKYNMNALHKLRPQIDKITQKYIDVYQPEAYRALCDELDKETDFLIKAYGKGKKKHCESYKKNVLSDMRARMGNALLKQIREYDKSLHSKKKISASKRSPKQKLKEHHRTNQLLDSMMWDLIIVLQAEMRTKKNQKIYRELMEEIEQQGGEF